MSNPHALPVVVLDGDDTLWRTMPLYTDAKTRFFSLMARVLPDADGVEVEFEDRDRRNVAKWGFTVERFRNSMVETYRARLLGVGLAPELKREAEISRIATSVLRRRAPLVPYARQILTRLSGHFRLVLVTKGEYELQQRRVCASGLKDLFERVLIVDHKDVDTFRQLKRELNVRPHSAWSIGDSLRSDIRPALAAGFCAIWIRQKTWSYEEDDQEMPDASKLFYVSSLRNVVKVLLPARRPDRP